MSFDNYDAGGERDDWSDLGAAEGKPLLSLRQTEFYLRQFAKRMGQANYRVFNKWKKVGQLGLSRKTISR